MLKFWGRSLYMSVFVFLMMWIFSIVGDLQVFNAFDPVGQALGDFQLTDYVFSKLRDDPQVEERVVLVNIRNLTRAEMAQEIKIISKYKPRVIGIDSYYNCEGGLYDTLNCPQLLDTLGNLLLANAIEEAGNVVLVSKLLQKDATSKAEMIDVYDSLEISDPMFDAHSKHAFANLVTGANYQEDVKQCRSFFPQFVVNDKRELAFAVQMTMMYDSVKTNKFLSRNNEEEILNYRGNFEMTDTKLKSLVDKKIETTAYSSMFNAIDVPDVFSNNFDSTFFKDKVVIMGFLGDYFGDPAWNDKYFTPLNKKVAGKTNPDMFGAVVHANIIVEILNEDYVNQLTDWQKNVIAVLTCILTIALFIKIDEKLPVWFDAFSVIIQLVQIIGASVLAVEVFNLFNFKLDLTNTMFVSAVVGPCYDIFKSFENEISNRLTKRREAVLKEQTS